MATVSLIDLAGKALGNDLDERLAAVAALRQELEQIEAHAVSDALREGWPWSKIGEAFGVSKQAVHRKYSRRGLLPPNAYRQHEAVVSASARLSVFMARREAASRGDERVGTEHLLLGMLQQGEGGACQALKEVGVTLQAARLQADIFFPSACADIEPSRLPLSKAARDALEQATNEVARRGDSQLETAHMLLALLRDPEANAAQILTGLGVSPPEVERAVDAQLSAA